MKHFIAFLALIVGLSGCRLGPRYEPPIVETPEEWKNQATEMSCESLDCPWWELFNDPTLNALEIEALTSNYSLQASIERVYQAWALAGISKAPLYPNVTLNPSFNDSISLFKLALPPAASSLIPPNATIFRFQQIQYLLPLTMNYEIDLWGKLRGQYESAVFTAEAQVEAYKTAQLTLTTEIASVYFQLRTLDLEIIILEKSLGLFQQVLQLSQSRYQQGLTTALDLASAEYNFANAEEAHLEAQRQRSLLENMMATLIGKPASLVNICSNPLQGDPPILPMGTPCSILLQRPDLAQAERTAAAEQRRIGVAYASFFPSLSFTGAIGYSSPDIKQFLTWPSRYWAIAADSTQSIFDAGKNLSNLDYAWARFHEASANYQQQVLTAFQEVEDALVNIEQQNKQYQSYLRAAQAADRRAELSLNQYNQGLVNNLDPLSNQQSALNAELNAVLLLQQRYLSTIQLIKAIGGSW